jgi:hypothetical protein
MRSETGSERGNVCAKVEEGEADGSDRGEGNGMKRKD